eukprot:CAMPEP_0116860300 /NCGR_PEP_ID=MMETSP0418-20121206/22330_1 /TAXON_ID=1158023 /ORGANISM="Astrosyne radiata, Strain 13vi08-1A" /LENGTH=339 /DNA_ID=CAMNT_0004494675 /DNA_START=3 /DNA_END=1022 /DNA_ORIENTATION=-
MGEHQEPTRSGNTLLQAVYTAAPIVKEVVDSMNVDQDFGKEQDGDFVVSVRALRGNRRSMEDEYCYGFGGRVAAVFDGHGGGHVSMYLRRFLLPRLKEQFRRKQWEEQDDDNDADVDSPKQNVTLASHVSAVRLALENLETEVLKMEALNYQGSTATLVTIHESEDGHKTLVTANLGDSRATLCRHGKAIDLTRDHKPSDEREKARIMALGGRIEWDHYAKVHRIRNLSLSRAIGDRFAKPFVSGDAEIQHYPVLEGDEFVILASDGLWDVMTSQEAVDLIRDRLESSPAKKAGLSEEERARADYTTRKQMSRYVAYEALDRGSGDNICVMIVWLHHQK